MERVGFAGVGRMGRWMALNLLKKGYPLTCYDLRSEAVEEMVKEGAKGVKSLQELARNSDIIFVMVVNAAQLESITLGADGLLRWMKPGDVLIVTSTINQKCIEKINEEAKKKDIAIIDAPVSGAQSRAKDGTMMLMAACEDMVWERCYDVLATVGSDVTHVDVRPGIGQLFKAINQMLVYANYAMTAEVVMLTEKAGADPKRMAYVIEHSRGNSVIFENKVDNYIKRDFEPMAQLAISKKDLSIAIEIAESLNSPVPVTKEIFKLFSAAYENGWGELDHSAIMKLYEKMNNRKENDNG